MPASWSTENLTTRSASVISQVRCCRCAAATEHVALTNAQVATFTDSNATDTAGDFTATIDWGDGSGLTAGTVSGSNGLFVVSGGHTYDDEGAVPVTVVVTRTTDNATLPLTGTTVVGENDLLSGTGSSFAVTTNQTFNPSSTVRCGK